MYRPPPEFLRQCNLDDMLYEMEWKNGNICDDSDSSCGEEHEIDYET